MTTMKRIAAFLTALAGLFGLAGVVGVVALWPVVRYFRRLPDPQPPSAATST